MQAVRVVVMGHVQGVGFRAFAVREAEALRVAGWVRNRPDGAVEAEARGDAETLQRFVKAFRRGPTIARVEHFTEQWFECVQAPAGFQVRG